MFDGWIGFAAAIRIAADVVLLRQSTRTQITQLANLMFDVSDTFFQRLLRDGHRVQILAYRAENRHRNGPVMADSLIKLSAYESGEFPNHFCRSGVFAAGHPAGSTAGEDFWIPG